MRRIVWKGVGKLKFDVVVGNPPFQETLQDTSDASLYNFFYDLAKNIGKKYVLISPARFLFNAGGTKKSWNKMMLSDEHLRVEYYNPKAEDVFPGTGFKGGIAVVYRDSENTIGPIGTFTNYPELNHLLAKVINLSGFESIIPLIHLQLKFDLLKLYKDHPKLKKVIGSNGKEKRLTTSIFSTTHIFSDSETTHDDVEVLGLINNQRFYKYISHEYLLPHNNLNKWKVILPKSNGAGLFGETLSNPLVGWPDLGHTQSFISIGSFETKQEADYALKYIKSKFCRALLDVLKITQDNNPATWANVPLQDFTEQSDINWRKSITQIDQ